MSYRISRNGQMYGPYSTEEVHTYLTSGHVLLTDLAMEENSGEWVPLSTLFPSAQSTGAAPIPPYNDDTAFRQFFEPPPNLNWGLLLLLIFVTGGFFLPVWYGILASWTKKITTRGAVPILYIACCVLLLIQLILMIWLGTKSPIYSLVTFLAAVLQLVTRFKMRTLLLEHYNVAEPFGLRLSGVMTFFFAELYFQYHFNQINRLKGLR